MTTTSLDAGAASVLAPSPANEAARPPVIVLDGVSGEYLAAPDLAPRTERAAHAANAAQRGLDYLRNSHNRNGVDDAGMGALLVLDDPHIPAATLRRNGEEIPSAQALWQIVPGQATDEPIEYLGFGAGASAAAPTLDDSADLVIHELGHSLIHHTTGLDDEQGRGGEVNATSEAMADVFAAVVTRDWRIGEDAFAADGPVRQARDLLAPTDPTSFHPMWSSIDEALTALDGGASFQPYLASGIVSTTFARTQDRIGGEAGWQFIEQVHYGALTTPTWGAGSFAEAASAIREAAVARYGEGDIRVRILDEELRRSGL
jgi:Zn-dependent metalloprotease